MFAFSNKIDQWKDSLHAHISLSWIMILYFIGWVIESVVTGIIYNSTFWHRSNIFTLNVIGSNVNDLEIPIGL